MSLMERFIEAVEESEFGAINGKWLVLGFVVMIAMVCGFGVGAYGLEEKSCIAAGIIFTLFFGSLTAFVGWVIVDAWDAW